MNSKETIHKKINDISDFHAQVDIIIPYHGLYDRVSALLSSIFSFTRSNYYEIYLVDDNSPNDKFIVQMRQNAEKNAQRLKQPNIIHTKRNETQLGFAGSCRVGYEMGESPYVCFLHSDCLIKDTKWLLSLGECLLSLKSQNVRVVSSKTNNAVNGDPAQFGHKSEGFTILEDSFLSLYCWMCHRELFNRIGGFLKEYPYGGYEDEEFAYRLAHYGYKQAVCHSSYVEHTGGATLKACLRQNPNLDFEQNRSLAIQDMRSIKNHN